MSCDGVCVSDFLLWHTDFDAQSNIIFLICVWFQNVIETARAPNRNASTLLRLPEASKSNFFRLNVLDFMTICSVRTELFRVYRQMAKAVLVALQGCKYKWEDVLVFCSIKPLPYICELLNRMLMNARCRNKMYYVIIM